MTKNSPLSITTKDLGKIYTPSILAQFISPRTITYFLFAQLNKEFLYGEFTSENILDIFDQFIERDLRRVYQILRNIKIIDPTVGSGNLLLESYRFLVSFFEYLKNKGIEKRSKVQFCQDIVQNNLFGVDISKTAINNCKESFLTILPFKNRNEKSWRMEVEHQNLGDTVLTISRLDTPK
ncbi:DNA methyltransferase, partial [Candidatus Hodarchaeum mangrovi]